MHDLDELVVAFDPAIRFGHNRATRSFTVESGGARLAEFFGAVRHVPMNGELCVTEIEPLVAYVLSGMNNSGEILRGRRLEAFRAYLQERLDTEGAVRIRTVGGMFIAGARQDD